MAQKVKMLVAELHDPTQDPCDRSKGLTPARFLFHLHTCATADKYPPAHTHTEGGEAEFKKKKMLIFILGFWRQGPFMKPWSTIQPWSSLYRPGWV